MLQFEFECQSRIRPFLSVL